MNRQQKGIQTVTARLDEQAAQIQKMSAQIEMGKRGTAESPRIQALRCSRGKVCAAAGVVVLLGRTAERLDTVRRLQLLARTA
jgi:hypothetical protein